jgi:hypothetical protein
MSRSLGFRAAILAAAIAVYSAAQSTRAPVLVELFTSEGCSSCPPADRLLEQMDSRVVVLSEHVDYWNHDGWTDPFSSPELTKRQERYSERFQLQGPYTPQMVIDGSVEFTGSDAARAGRELSLAAKRPKADVHLERSGESVRVKVEGARPGTGVFLALADESGDSSVAAGENRGRRLHHIAILRSLRKLGKIEKSGSFEGELALPAQAREQRVIVFLQEGDAGPVRGVAMVAAEK